MVIVTFMRGTYYYWRLAAVAAEQPKDQDMSLGVGFRVVGCGLRAVVVVVVVRIGAHEKIMF